MGKFRLSEIGFDVTGWFGVFLVFFLMYSS